MDVDNTGFIDADELKEAMKNSEFNIPDKDIESIIKEIDYAGNGQINYSEFLAATISAKSFLTEAKLFSLFKQFDIDNSEFITEDNLKEAFKKIGRSLSGQEMKVIMSSHDVSNDGKISYEEFKKMLLEDDNVDELIRS